MFKFFNALQYTMLLVAWPVILHYLHTAEFWGAPQFLWIGGIAFLLQFGYTVYAMTEHVDKHW